tara:strand:+ start:358 stop:1269 length:912 start_codon:yes stop_codon:yes gene_type:complete
MLDYVGLAPEHVIGEVPVRRRFLTAEQAAANAVMAGCLPTYFPVVLATLEVLFQYDPNCVHHASCTTNCATLGIIVNGPIRHEIGLNCTNDMLSPGNRANSTIGRAVRLIMINVFEQRPGLLDQGCMGSLAKHGLCFGEDEEGSPWSPFHVSQGFKPENSTVTVATIQDPEMVCNRYGLTAESVMDSVAEVIASHGMATFGHQWIWIVGYWHAQMLWNQGWDRPAMRQYVWERAWRSQAHLKRIGAVIGEVAPEDETTRVYAAGSPEDIFIMAGGGDSGSYSEVIMIYHGVPAITNIINESSS